MINSATDEGSNAGLIIGIVVAVLVLVAVSIVVVLLLRRASKSKGIYLLSSVLPLHIIASFITQVKRPINFRQGGLISYHHSLYKL
jgi:bacteriorhodopsin